MKNLEKYIKQNYPIQTGINNPILRKKSEKVVLFNNELKDFAVILTEAMEMYDGIGLASPQIGINKRIISVCQLDKKLKKIIFSDIMINPEIIEKNNKKEYFLEGCLSLPGIEAEVKRRTKIKIKYQDINGNYKEITGTGYNAAILQHEIDHLNGILFIDKAKKKKELDLSKLLKL